MNSWPRYWPALVLALAVSLAGKAFLDDHRGSEAGNEDRSVRELHAFLVNQKVGALTPLRVRPLIPDWQGWRFTVGDCPATAFPLPISGELNATARDHAGPADRVDYLYQGQQSLQAPLAANSLVAMTERFFQTKGPTDRHPRFYVMVIHPAACAAVLGLPWRRLD